MGAQGKFTTKDAVKMLPMSEGLLQRWLREAYYMKCMPCPFGFAIFSEQGQWIYCIFEERLEAYLSARDLTLVSDTRGDNNA